MTTRREPRPPTRTGLCRVPDTNRNTGRFRTPDRGTRRASGRPDSASDEE
ncbi:hypothetical protein ACWC5C_23265 [Streptomyces sp. NPDC001700]